MHNGRVCELFEPSVSMQGTVLKISFSPFQRYIHVHVGLKVISLQRTAAAAGNLHKVTVLADIEVEVPTFAWASVSTR